MTYVKSHYAAIGALIVTLLTTIQGAGHLDRANIATVVIAALGAVLAFFLQNTAGGVRHYSQAIINTLIVAAQIVAPFILDGRITYAQAVVVLVTIVQGAAAFWEPDKPETTDRRAQDAGTTVVDVTTPISAAELAGVVNGSSAPDAVGPLSRKADGPQHAAEGSEPTGAQPMPSGD